MYFPRNRYSFIAMIHDLFMAALSLWLAHYLRLGNNMLEFSGHYLWPATFGFVVLAAIVFAALGLYRGLWRYASMQDLLTLTKAVGLLLLLFYTGLFLSVRLEGVPRSVPIIHALLLIALLGAPRFAYRIIKDRRQGIDFSLLSIPKIPVLLVGATDAAELFIRESKRNPQSPYHVVGIIDDNPTHHGQQMHNIRIYGGSDSLKKIIQKLERKGCKPQRIVLAESRPDGEKVRELLQICEKLGLPLSRLPKTLELQTGNITKLETKPIAVEDLLRRAQKVHDLSQITALISNKTVLITGAGGTIGSELVRQIALLKPKKLLLLEHAEYQLYLIEQELADNKEKYKLADCNIIPILGDIRDLQLLDALFSKYKPNLIFHAAALKHVPLAELNPIPTITTNIFGTKNLADMAIKYKSDAMVLISTDKAVYPANIMGASKRMAERILQTASDNSNHSLFVTVRFGNVLGSAGSVVPRFQAQLASGGPITITHPDMTRYFMTVREAVELVIQAAAIAADDNHNKNNLSNNNGIFVLDMGDPIKIEDLARQMIILAGLNESDIAIKYTGLRPGEKLHEKLFYDHEKLHPTSHSAIWYATSSLSFSSSLQQELKDLSKLCADFDIEKAVQYLNSCVQQ